MGFFPQVYHKLVQSQSFNVKITLALSLHEVARILGASSSKLVEEELVAVFEEMIQVSGGATGVENKSPLFDIYPIDQDSLYSVRISCPTRMWRLCVWVF